MFDEKTKSYRLDDKPKILHGEGELRAALFKQRLLMTQQRLLRDGHFTQSKMSAKNTNKGKYSDSIIELSTIESLLGSEGTKCLFGMLTQPESGKIFLEDLTSSIQLDLSACEVYDPNVFYTLGSQVIVSGELKDRVFRTSQLMFPPAESRAKSLSAMNLLDPYGKFIRPDKKVQLQEMENESQASMFIILSDILLDKPGVFDKLQKLFEGYEGIQQYLPPNDPLVFILMGSFVSVKERGSSGRESIKAAFQLLSDAICNCPYLAEMARFIIIPGPQDPGLSIVLPRQCIPEEFSSEMSKKIKHIYFSSNPSRIRYYTQDIVIFREDLLKKIQRNTVNLKPLSEGNGNSNNGIEKCDEYEMLTNTLLKQGHLSPLPLDIRPIYWDLDYTLSLNPLPDLLIVGDVTDQYVHEHEGTISVNPGSFTSDSSFVCYRPYCEDDGNSDSSIRRFGANGTKVIEFSKL